MTSGDRAFWFYQAFLRNITFGWARPCRSAIYRRYFKKCGPNLCVHDDVLIKYPSTISLGSNVTINKGCILIGSGDLVIGDYAMIGAGTKLVTTLHKYDRIDIPMALQGLSFERIEVGRDVWFGFDCIVLPGTTIGEGCIIAAGAVLGAGTYPPFSVIAGNPGRKIRDRRELRAAQTKIADA